MSVLPELLPIALELMKNKYIGTLNFTNPGVISHNEILALCTRSTWTGIYNNNTTTTTIKKKYNAIL
jgi:hypothetical protein